MYRLIYSKHNDLNQKLSGSVLACTVMAGKPRRPAIVGKIPLCNSLLLSYQSGADHKSGTNFLIEACVMGQFKNLNVITLEGVVTRSKFNI